MAGKTFNAGSRNYPVTEIGEIVRSVVFREMPALDPIGVETMPFDGRGREVAARWPASACSEL